MICMILIIFMMQCLYMHMLYLIIFPKTSSKKLLTLKTYVVKKAVSHPEKFLGRFQLGVLSTFLNTSKMLLTYIVLHNSSLFFFNCLRCSFEQNIRKLRNLPDNNFVFLFFHFGNIFWAPITFERYHFQFGYDPERFSLERNMLF